MDEPAEAAPRESRPRFSGEVGQRRVIRLRKISIQKSQIGGQQAIRETAYYGGARGEDGGTACQDQHRAQHCTFLRHYARRGRGYAATCLRSDDVQRSGSLRGASVLRRAPADDILPITRCWSLDLDGPLSLICSACTLADISDAIFRLMLRGGTRLNRLGFVWLYRISLGSRERPLNTGPLGFVWYPDKYR